MVFDTMQLPCSDGDEARDRLQSATHKCTHVPPLEWSFRRFWWSSVRRCTLQTVPGSSASLRGHVHSSILEDVFIKAPSQLTSTHSFRRTDWTRASLRLKENFSQHFYDFRILQKILFYGWISEIPPNLPSMLAGFKFDFQMCVESENGRSGETGLGWSVCGSVLEHGCNKRTKPQRWKAHIKQYVLLGWILHWGPSGMC